MPVSTSVAVAHVSGKSHERFRGIRCNCCGCMERELFLHSRPWHPQNLRRPQPCHQPAPPPADMLCENRSWRYHEQHPNKIYGVFYFFVHIDCRKRQQVNEQHSIYISISSVQKTSRSDPGFAADIQTKTMTRNVQQLPGVNYEQDGTRT